MIEITNLIKYTTGFDLGEFTIHQRAETLRERKYKQTAQGWFNTKGRFIAQTAEQAINKLGLNMVYKKIIPNRFYVLTQEDEPVDGSSLVSVHGSIIMGVYEEQVVQEEVERVDE